MPLIVRSQNWTRIPNKNIQNLETGTMENPVFRICIHLILIWILIQPFRLNINPDQDPIRIKCFDDKKLKKFTEQFFLYPF
jgi:hypothetical protein